MANVHLSANKTLGLRTLLGAVVLGVAIAGMCLHVLLAALGLDPAFVGPNGPFDLLGLGIIGWGGLELLNEGRFVKWFWLLVVSVIPLKLIFLLEEPWQKAICLGVSSVLLVALYSRWKRIIG